MNRGEISFASKLARKVRSVLRSFVRSLFGYPVLRNVNLADESIVRKRALFVYLTEPFELSLSDPRFRDHQNVLQSRQIAAALGNAGYVVDVVDVNDEKYFERQQKNEYDLVLSHRVSLGRMVEVLSERTTRVYFATGMNHGTFNANMTRRYERLRTRRACAISAPAVNSTDMPFVASADAIVAFGNAYSTGTWKAESNALIFQLNNYGFDDVSASTTKDFANARSNFLFFASRNQLGKGLDLLLEIFPQHPELNLYVCSLFKNEPDFCECYEKELFQTPNVHAIGAVRVGSREFDEICSRCTFIVLPSCTEGQPGSVIQAMHMGLLPIVTRECGIDVEGFGWQFEDDSEKSIESLIGSVARLDRETLERRSMATRDIASREYSEAAFLARWAELAQAFKTLRTKETST